MNNFPTELHKLIASIESDNNLFAMRFEHGMYDRLEGIHYFKIKAANKCSNDTAKMIGATSWGLYQLLGVNVYADRGNWHFGSIINKFINNASLQHICFSEFIHARGINYSVSEMLNDRAKLTKFVTRYNGPGNVVAYSDRFIHRAKELKLA